MKVVIFVGLFFVTISILSPQQVKCQDFSTLRNKATQAVKSKRQGVELVFKDEQDKEVSFNWRFEEGGRKKGIRIVIFWGKSKKDAVARMELVNKFLPLGPGKKLNDLGDEAYWSESSSKDFSVIRFRKANVFVGVDAPSRELAEDLARDLAKSIKKSN